MKNLASWTVTGGDLMRLLLIMYKTLGYSPDQALGAVLVAGVVFLAISLTPLRAWIINSIPKSLKLGIGAGIGLFLAIIGLQIKGGC